MASEAQAGDVMNASEFLKRYMNMSHEISIKCDEIAKLRSLAEKMTQSLSFTGGGESGFGMGAIKCEMEDLAFHYLMPEEYAALEKQIDSEVEELMSVRAEIESVVGEIRNPLYKMIIWRKYIIGERFEVIADKESYTFQYIKNAHSQALKVVDSILNRKEIRSE